MRLFGEGCTHIVGIGGAGLSALAAILLDMGEDVSGCDRALNAETRLLEQRGARVYPGHDESHAQGVDRMVFTRATSLAPELALAREMGIPVINRAELLGQLMDRKRGIAVAGTHGKTTTTSLLASMLIEDGLDPAVLVGGVPAGWALGGRWGGGDWMVAEADEFDRSFLHLHPELAVLTGIDMDHPDTYTDIDDLKGAFASFLLGLREGGRVFAYAGSERGLEAARHAARTHDLVVETYGDVPGADWKPVFLAREGNVTRFELRHDGEALTDLSTTLVGRHNLNNIAGAIVAARDAGVAVDSVRRALRSFRGVGRRFELKGEAAGVTVVDDYAHHPAEIEANITAARAAFPDARLWVAFQPHTYTRTRELMDGFADALQAADRAYVLDVYAAREQPEPGVTGERLAELAGPVARYAGGIVSAAQLISAGLKPGTLLLTMGAGDVTTLGPLILEELERRKQE